MKTTFLHTSRQSALSGGLALTAGCACLLALPNVAAAQSYTIANLGTLSGNAVANGLSANGTATGYSTLADGSTVNAFLTAPGGVIQNLGTLGGSNSYGQAITSGALTQVAGYSDTGVGATSHAFLYTASGVGGPAANPQMRDLGTLSGVSTDNSEAFGINTLGQVVGDSINAAGGDHAFRTAPNAAINGATDDLGTLGGISSLANAVNASGQAVGQADLADGSTHAFRSALNGAPNSLTDLGTLGGTFSTATAINAAGQVVGQSDLAPDRSGNTASHAFVWTQGATNGAPGNMQMTDLGSLGGDSEANSINDLGAIVGFSLLADGSTFDAFLDSGGKMIDLNSLISPSSGWQLEDATSINDNGQIAGYGLFQGQTRAFLLNAAPEPSVPLALAIGLGTLGLLAARKRRTDAAR